jgi:hypothetical protein
LPHLPPFLKTERRITMDEETVVHCNLKENALLIADILDADAEGKVYTPNWNVAETPVGARAWELAQEIYHLLSGTLKWSEVSPLVGKRAAELAYDCCDVAPRKAEEGE